MMDRHAFGDRLAIEPPEACLPLGHRQAEMTVVTRCWSRSSCPSPGQCLTVAATPCAWKAATCAMAWRSMVSISLPNERVPTMALRQAALMSMTGVKLPVEAHRPRLLRHDGGNLPRRRHVVHRGQPQRIGHAGAEGQAHPAALEVGADQQGNGADPPQCRGSSSSSAHQVVAIDARDAARLEARRPAPPPPPAFPAPAARTAAPACHAG